MTGLQVGDQMVRANYSKSTKVAKMYGVSDIEKTRLTQNNGSTNFIVS